MALLRHAMRLRSVTRPGIRWASTGSFKSLRLTQHEKLPSVTTLEMCKKPVNSLNAEFVNELTQALDMLENDKYTKGLIITSAIPGIFTAGLDIISELYQPNYDEFVAFWKAMQNFYVKLYASPLLTIAAINGASPAGGCVMALACDHRIIADDERYKIGLNEVQLDFIAPSWVVQWFVLTVGNRHAEKAAQLGTLHTPAEALNIGLVDHVVPPERLNEYSLYTMGKCLKVSRQARQLIKQQMRLPVAQKILSTQAEDTAAMASYLTRDSVQRSIGTYIQSLKKGKK